MRGLDWAVSPLGTPETWPESLKAVVKLALSSRQPIFIWWGPKLIQFYNDAYSQTMGPEKHPAGVAAADTTGGRGLGDHRAAGRKRDVGRACDMAPGRDGADQPIWL